MVLPVRETAFLTAHTVSELLDPANLNSGRLQEIYAAREARSVELHFLSEPGRPQL